MSPSTRALGAFLVLAAVTSIWAPTRADAACDTTGTDTAYGDYWIERSGANCDCVFKARTYSCVATGGNRTESAPVTLTTLAGSCDTACEDLSGYGSAVATVAGYYVPGSGYNCDTVFTDQDGDRVGACIDYDETRYRIGVKTSGINERVCDGLDNDADGTIDDGFTACPLDQRRVDFPTNLQGEGANKVNVVELMLLRTEVDATIAGPYGPLTFARTYNSRRETNDAAIGHGWTHSLAVYLTAMPSGDDRYQVQTPSGTMQYFRCDSGTTDRSCVIDDHRPAGNLRRISSVWYYYPGDGTRYAFSETAYSGRQPYTAHVDAAGNTLSTATVNGDGTFQKILTANASLGFYFSYDSDGMTAVHINAASGAQILDLDVTAQSGGWKRLDKIKYASAINTIDTDTFVAYAYDSTTHNLTAVTAKLDASTTVTLADFTYDGSDRLSTLKDDGQDLSLSVYSGIRTDITFNVEASGNPSTHFVHNSIWLRARDTIYHLGGMSALTEVRDDSGRITCRETADSRMTKYDYTSSWQPTRTDVYGKTGDCTSGGSVERQVWHSWAYNTARQSWRTAWTREKSQYSPASDCSGSSLPAGCKETKYEYVSSTDDRVQWVTETGSTRAVSGAVTSTSRKYRRYYYGLDTGTCASSGDWYTGLVCRTETQNAGGTVYAQTRFTYEPSGTYAGLPKSVAAYRTSGDAAPLTTSFGSYNAFGTPLVVTAPSGVATTYTMNGWNAPTQMVEADAILDSSSDPAADDVTTAFAYNKLRRVSTVTLPKLNRETSIYYTGATDYARLKASARADSSGNLQEIVRYVHDKFGNVIEDRTLDSINGTTPCADETCATYDVVRHRTFNALRQVTEAALYASSPSSPDGTQSYTYTNGQLTAVSDYRGTTSAITYDSQGRPSSNTRDSGGIAAQTQYAYDLSGRTATVTSPISVPTHYEYDDFGQLVLERSKTRGDLRYEYDVGGRQTQRKRTTYKATTETESTCYTYDYLGRLLTVDYACGGGAEWTLDYDGDHTPASACPGASSQRGHLSMMTGPDFTRVLCYHPSGNLYASYQIESTTWSNSSARGTQTIFDGNGNLTYEVINASPSSRSKARHVEYLYQSSLPDRIDYVRTKLDGGSWTEVTSSSTDPTYFAYGGLKTLTYGNGITETNERDYADRLKRRKTAYSSTIFTDINLSFDLNGNVTAYDDSTGYRHLKYTAAMDKLDRLRCLSRTTISSCTGAEPWEAAFLESFDYDASGNRTNRRSGEFNTADDDAYSYVSGPTDIISSVAYGGSSLPMYHDFKGGITTAKSPNVIELTYDEDDRVTSTNDEYLGSVSHSYSYFGDRYRKVSPCNEQATRFFYRPSAEVGASPYVNLIDLYDTCESEYPRHHRTFIYLDGRPLAVAQADQANSGAAPVDEGVYWVHTDHLGTPVLVTNSARTERWRWENDPFGRSQPIEYTVSASDVSPDDDSSSGTPAIYNTCCCTVCGVSGCGGGTSGCASNCCDGGDANGLVWSKTYAPGSANNVRVHFAQFDVKAGSTRTAKDYVQVTTGSDAVVATLTGALGEFWGPWTNDSSAKVKLYADNVADGTRGVVVDKLEYTTATNGRFVMHLRFPGQVWDEEVQHAYNYQRWYRAGDGRYLAPDPVGLSGGEDGYAAYAGSNPQVRVDPTGLLRAHPGRHPSMWTDARIEVRNGGPPAVGFWPTGPAPTTPPSPAPRPSAPPDQFTGFTCPGERGFTIPAMPCPMAKAQLRLIDTGDRRLCRCMVMAAEKYNRDCVSIGEDILELGCTNPAGCFDYVPICEREIVCSPDPDNCR